jgi:hypothetical protein
MTRAGSNLAAVLMLLALITALPALGADNGIRAGKLELYPTFECIGLRLSFEGDDNANATAAVRYREKGQAVWRQALPLPRIVGSRFAGSIFFLTPGTAYEVEVTVSDPDGMQNGTVTGVVSTRSDRFPTGGGKEYWVAPGGDDSNRGTAASPFRTIQKAADLARPGDVVRVLPGVYREQVKVTAVGRPDAYIKFEAVGEGVILTGADQRYEDPFTAGKWRDEGQGVFSAEPGFLTRYLAADGIRMYHYVTRGEFDEFLCGAPGGWYQDSTSGKLFLRLASGADPNRVPVQIARLDAGFQVKNAGCVLIEGFEIRHYGFKTSGAGVLLEDAAWCVVRDCSIHGMNGEIVLAGPRAEGNLIEDCEIWDTSMPDWPWSMTKSHDEEGGGVMSTGGRGNVVRGNRMHGLFDGLSLSYWDKLEDEAYNCDWDIYDNEIYCLRDDIAEPEGPCINIRFWNNVCYNLFAGISLAPINVGPTYVMYNSISDTKIKDIKYSGDASGWCYILHNSFFAKNGNHSLIDLNSPLQTQVFRNNVFYSAAGVLRSRRLPLKTVDVDYNLWYSSDLDWYRAYTGLTHKRLFNFEGKDYFFLKDVQAALGWEMHGIQADPLYVCPESGNLRLLPASPAIDKGEVLPNINDGFRGSAPDMGAYEFGSDLHGAFPLGRSPRAR